jgi:hypothetical protein
MRWIPLVLLPLFALAALVNGTNSSAQGQPPNRFFGTARLNGAVPPTGTPVTAFIGSQLCGTGDVREGGRYVVDVDDDSRTPGCGINGAAVTFRIGSTPAAQTGSYSQGAFTELNLTAPAQAGAPRLSEAVLVLADPRPCMPAPCDPGRAALWNGDAAAWAARGVTDPDARFGEIILMRVQAGEPSVIGNIARILGNPYLQITRLRFVGTDPGQADEFIEITNLGGGDQDMSGWIVRSPARGAVARFPAGYVMNPAQSCRIYTAMVTADSCGTASFDARDVWPDDSGVAVLFYEALALPGAERRYSADPGSQPPQPDLQGVE